MKYPLLNQKGIKIGEAELSNRIFGVGFSSDVVHQAVLAQQGGHRQVLAGVKDRGEVRGGGKKPWAQKGTGRARHGSIRSPLWRGGGVTFGPSDQRNFSKKINKKAKQKALFMVLSQKVKDKELVLLDQLSLDRPKTKEAFKVFQDILKSQKAKKREKMLIVTPPGEKDLVRASRNISFAKTIAPNSLNVVDLLAAKYLIVAQGLIPLIEKTYQQI